VHQKQSEQLQAETVSLARQTNLNAVDGVQHWRNNIEKLSLCSASCMLWCKLLQTGETQENDRLSVASQALVIR
jgi:hypothetical protein